MCNELVIKVRLVLNEYYNCSEKEKEKIKKQLQKHNKSKDVKVGTNIVIVEMKGEPNYKGKLGTIIHIDDAGQIYGTWGGCALIPGVDAFLTI